MDPLPDPQTGAALSRSGTALLAGGALVVGFAVAQGTGVRALGGLLLLLALAGCARSWQARSGTAAAAVLSAAFVGLFVLSHVLSLGLGVPAWASVAVVAVTMTATAYVVDRGRRAS